MRDDKRRAKQNQGDVSTPSPLVHFPAPHRHTASKLTPKENSTSIDLYPWFMFLFFVNIDPCLPVCLPGPFSYSRATAKKERKIGKQKKTASRASRAKRRPPPKVPLFHYRYLYYYKKNLPNPTQPEPPKPNSTQTQPTTTNKRQSKRKETNHETLQQTTTNNEESPSKNVDSHSRPFFNMQPQTAPQISSTAGQNLSYLNGRPEKNFHTQANPLLPRQTFPHPGKTLSYPREQTGVFPLARRRHPADLPNARPSQR